MKRTIEIHVNDIRHKLNRFCRISLIDIENGEIVEDYFYATKAPVPPLFRWDNNKCYLKRINMPTWMKRIYVFLFDTARNYMNIFGKKVDP